MYAAEVCSLAVSARQLMVGCVHGEAWLRDLDTGRHQVRGIDFDHGTFVHGALGTRTSINAVSIHGNHVFTGGEDGYFMIWNAASGKRILRIACETAIKSIAVCGQTVFASYGSSVVPVWDMSTGGSVAQPLLLLGTDTWRRLARCGPISAMAALDRPRPVRRMPRKLTFNHEV